MYSVIETEAFADWVDGLRDMPTRIRLRRRINKAKRGNLGDIKAVGDGVWEMREFFGPGWRMYYIQRGDVLIVMLGGGAAVVKSNVNPQDGLCRVFALIDDKVNAEGFERILGQFSGGVGKA